MIRKITILYILILLSNSNSDIDDLKIYDSLAFEEMVYLKIVSFDTIPGFINYHNRTTQYEYSQIFCTNLKIGFNANTSFEILDADSKIEPNVNLHIKFKDLYTDSKEVKDRRRCYTSCTIKIIGKLSKDNTPVFTAISRRKSRGDDLEDELRDNIIEIARDTYNDFESLRPGKIKKSFQYYDFNCNDSIETHFIFANVTNPKAIKLLYDVADAEIQNECIENNFPLKRLYLKQIDSILINESIDFNKRKNVISQNLKTYLLSKGVNSLLFIHGLNCDLPYDEKYMSGEKSSRLLSSTLPVVPALIVSSFLPSNINDVDNAFCKMFFIRCTKK